MCHTIKRFAVLCLVPLLLSACLPGESESQKSLNRTTQAATTVQAEQIAVSMINTATRLVMSSEPANNVDNADLIAQICNDKVVAYIPKTAKITRDNAVPLPVARHMRSYLESRLGQDSVIVIENTQQNNSPAPSPCYENIALNSPVIVMDLNMAQTIQTPEENEDGLIAISMAPCEPINDQPVPGVVITRTYADGTSQTEEHCGTAAPTDLPEIILGEGQIIDWQKRLAGETDYMRNVVCIASEDGCTPMDDTMATQIICPPEDDQVEYIANPLFDTSDYQFKPDPADVSCGRGWTGELTARVKSKVCQIVRNGETVDEQPAKVFDIAYIGAQCKKDEVFLYETCPAGYPNSADGHVVTRQDVQMVRPITLAPSPTAQQGVNYSELAYLTDTGSTNMSQDIIELVNQQGGITIKRPNGESNNVKLFYSSANLNEADVAFEDSNDEEFIFDHRFTEQIAAQSEASEGTAGTFDNIICYGAAQTCKNGMVPEMMAVVVDRSGSMAALLQERVMPKQTSCRATMANLFQTQPRFNACKAAKEWHALLQNNNYTDENGNTQSYEYKRIQLLGLAAPSIANGQHDPITYISELHSDLMTFICEKEGLSDCTSGGQFTSIQPVFGSPSLTAQLNGKMIQMRLALRNSNAYLPRVKYGLMIGHDCYPSIVRDDSYGTCAPVFASTDDLNASDYTSEPLRTCQSSCPGECVTDAVERTPPFEQNGYDIYPSSANVPQDYAVNRMQLVDSFVQSNLIPNLPYGIKFYYSEFIGSGLYNPTISFTLGDPESQNNTPDHNSQNQAVDMGFWIRSLYAEMQEHFETRNNSVGYATGGTPLYTATHRALVKLKTELLDADPDAVAALVVLTDGVANFNDTPPNYFQNLCGVAGRGGFNNSLVKYLGDHYKNVKLYYLHIGTDNSPELQACANNHTYNGKQIVYSFHYNENAADTLHNASNAIAGANDLLPPEIGEEICINKFGTNVSINHDTIPGHMPTRPLNHGTHILGSCEGYVYLDPDNTNALPPFNLRNGLVSIIPAVGEDYNPYDESMYMIYGMPGDGTCTITDPIGGDLTGGDLTGGGYTTDSDSSDGYGMPSGRPGGDEGTCTPGSGPVCTGDIDPFTYEVCVPDDRGGDPIIPQPDPTPDPINPTPLMPGDCDPEDNNGTGANQQYQHINCLHEGDAGTDQQ